MAIPYVRSDRTRDIGEGKAALRVVVDRHACQSNAVCMGFAPEVFEVTYDGTLLVLDECPPETLRESVEEAARSCPRQAISIEDSQLHVSAQT